MFFDQICTTATASEKVVEAAQANSLDNFSAWFGKVLNGLFIDCMDSNEEIFARVMGDKAFREAAQEHLAREVYERVHKGKPSD